MNKIYKVMYSKVKQCAVVVSEIAKSHGHNGESSGVRKHAALTAAVLIALGSLSFTTAFMPMTAEADDLTKTDGSNFVGVERRNGLFDDSDYANHNGKGAHGDDSITVGLKASGGDGTITIGDRRAEQSLGSVYVGRGPGMPTGKVLPDNTDNGYWATSVGYQSDATGYGSIAIGSNATANNSYDKDSTGHGITLRTTSGDGKTVVLNGKPDIQRASVAIGYGANADNGNIAIGSYSDASTDLRTAKTAAYLTDTTADSYVSVGKSDALRRISNVADGAADSDVATIGQLKALSDKAGVYNEGWGIKIDKTNGNTISVNHNLGNNMNAQLSSTGLILGGDFSNTYDGKYGGAAGDYAVTLGGESNFALGNISVIAGGYGNHASGELSFIGGGNRNSTSNQYAAILGGVGNSASGESSVVTGGAYNTASGTESFVGGGHGNIAVGGYSAVIGGWDNRALGDPYGSSITTVVGGYQNTANGYQAMVSGGYQNVAWGRDTLVSGGRYNTVLGEMEDGWTQLRLSDASAFGGEGSVVQGLGSVGLAGGSTGKTAYLALAAGYQSVVTDGAAKLEANFSDYGILPVYKDIASAIGYQSTANEAGTISFGHDAGDVSGYTVKWEEDKDPTHDAIDYGSNDYTKTPTVTENHYDDAYYNRLVKVADGIDNHDAVTREQVQYIGGIYGTDKNDSNYGGRGATGTNSVAIGSNAVATEDNVVSFGNPDIPAVNIPESRKITHSVSLSDTDKTAINNVLGFDVTNDENWPKISGLKDLVIVNSLGSATYAQDIQKLANNPEFMELLNKVNTALGNGTLTQEQIISFEKYANGTEVETTDAVNIPAKAANYRRVVNMADGINPHDAVAMEQLEDYAKTDASNIGNKITVYKTDENGKSVEDTDATTAARNKSKDDWGEALGVDSLTTAGAASSSDQLITGKTLYNYDKPVADDGKTLSIVSADKTTGQNLSALDTQVKANTDALIKPNHNIKYYAVDETTLPKLTNFNGKDYSNEKNDGAKGMGSIAAGYNTHADGIISTVAGSYSGVINQGTAGVYDLRGATALSYGSFNVNQNTDSTKAVSGVANSIVGQANVTTDSNAAIIYGAGNTVTNSYRDIDTSKVNLNKVKQDLKNKDVAAVIQDAQKAVSNSGGQVMVMGGGNNVDSAYMTQVVGVGNTVKGNQVYTKDAKTGEWNWTTDTNDETAIEDYDPKKSSQYNYVDGFSNEVINGKHDYVIGANNTVTGDSYDDKDAKKYSNESNIIFGDNHTVTNTKNAVIIGSSDTQMTLDKGDNATAIGHNASAQRDALAVGVNTQARGNAVALGTSSTAHNNSIAIGTKATAVSSQNLAIGWEAHIGNIKTDDEKIKNAIALGSDSQVKVNDLLESDNNRGVLSIGDKDKERRIIHVRAGVNDTDAVNVSQLKSVQSGLTDKGLTFVTNDGERTAKLGSKVTIQGTAKKDGHEYTADNLTTEIDGSGNITILMDKDMSTETLAVNGKDGKNGQPGTAGSIGINGQDGQSGVGIDGKDGISIKGKDGKDGVTIKAVDGQNGTEGHIGLTGPAGTNGKDGTNAIDITVKNGYDGANGINGKNGVDGTSLTRIVYTDKAGEHQVATMEDGLKFKGDDTKVIAKKLNNTMEIIGGADSKNLTDGNIGVNSTDKGQLKVQLSKNLTGMNSTTYTTTTGEGDSATTSTTVVNGNGLTINNGPSITNNGIDGGKKTITNVGSGIEAGTNGKYTVTDANKSNAANIGDVNNMVNQAVDKLSNDTKTDLAGKANVNANNVGANISGSVEEKETNEKAWASAIGTGNIDNPKDMLITDTAVHNEVRPTEDGNYVKTSQTTGQNLTALDIKIGKLDENTKYNYIDAGKNVSISDNLTKLDTQVKENADAIQKNSEDIQNITNNVKNLSDNAVQYDKDSNKTKVTLGGEGGTTITNVKDGALDDKSTDAVNGKQLYSEQQAREKADKEINEKVTNNTTAITELKDLSNITDNGKNVIRNLAKGSVKVIAGTNTTVTEGADGDAKTYAVNVEGNGMVESGNTGLISGGTAYTELRPADGSYVKQSNTTAANLTVLDTQLKTTSDLIHTNDNGDTIQIGGSSTATKIDVSGKDNDGNTTGRVVTGVVTDVQDASSAANVGYVNGVTAANTQQIYRDMNNAYGRLNNNINKAAAGSNALAALHPLDYDPDDKADFAVGYGHYRNANAAAVGAFYHPNENTMVNVGVSLGNGDPGFNAGVSFKIGSGSAGHQAMSKTEMAKVINSQSKEIDALKKDNADKDKRIDALEQKMAEILAKLDKNGK